METFENQSVIITLDVDSHLYDKLTTLSNEGFTTVEINRGDPALLSRIINDFPKLNIGASNIIDNHQFEACYQAGVNFITSPGFLSAIAQTAHIYSVNYIPGVATISEAMQALAVGCRQVRPYPASLTFCSKLNKCLPDLAQYPAEVEIENIEHYFNLPSVTAVSILNPDIEKLPTLKVA